MLLVVPFTGITQDEERQATYGDLVLLWITSWFKDESLFEYQNLFLYGAIIEAPLQALSRVLPWDRYTDRHVLTVGLGVVTVWATYRVASELWGRWAGFLGGIFLILTPMFSGLAANNSKDIPFAAAYTLVIAAIVRYLPTMPRFSSRAALVIGGALGFALGIRVAAAVLVVPLGLSWLAVVAHGRRSPLRELWIALPRLCLMAGVAYGIMLISWPWAMQRPLVHPLVGLLISSRFVIRGPILYGGQIMELGATPATYPLTYFAIQLPEFVLVGVAAAMTAVVLAPSRTRWPYYVAPVAAILFPLLLAIAGRVTLYNAVRHLLFIVPALSAIAACGWLWLLHRFRRHAAPLVVLLALMALTTSEMSRLFPYHYVYFNHISGGLPAAAGAYETEYWGMADRIAAEWILDHYPSGRIANCAQPATVEWFVPPERYAGSLATNTASNWDFMVAGPTCHRDFSGILVHSVTRRDVPLVHVFSASEPGTELRQR